MEFKDYYKIMGVARDATPDDIKRAHRKLARKYHPDVSKEKDAEVRFKELGEAYEVLKDPEKRAAYDQLGANWKAGQDFRPPPEWNAGAEYAGSGFDRGFNRGDAGDHSDFFESLFRQGFASTGDRSGGQSRGRRATFSARGEDHHAKIQIDLEDSYSGATRTLSLRVPEMDDQGHVVAHEHQITFTIPKGIRAGQHIRLAGQGAPGMGEGGAGDLYLDVEFRPRPPGSLDYRVDKHDVYLDLPVAPWEAALGAEVQAPTPTGQVEVKIPAGSPTGRKLRLKGRGLPGTTPGDFYLVLQIVVPAGDTDTAKSFYEGMAKQFKAFNPRAKLGGKT
ncbi:MAG TPA: cytochrome C biogenesis protein [Polaromonas sp.]|uniref:DnaJ C-terminal domain-containing protein n=1 Tax=Polaromonas sp. UBA4122 TaxID=1947074 RepID=UPI000EE29B0B|nr:DnaJ C-terminal domain-containing protein [Polaromonas sp. UBA4122]HAL38581.1 cytochrome C biogenesis protein [Polaromonas sp.]